MMTFMSLKHDGLCTSTALLVQNLITHISGLPEYKKLLQHYHDERKKGNPCRYPKFEMGMGLLLHVQYEHVCSTA